MYLKKPKPNQKQPVLIILNFEPNIRISLKSRVVKFNGTDLYTFRAKCKENIEVSVKLSKGNINQNEEYRFSITNSIFLKATRRNIPRPDMTLSYYIGRY